MKEKNGSNETNFVATRFNFAIVLNAPYSSIQKIKEAIGAFDDVRVIYQDLDRGKLWITKKE